MSKRGAPDQESSDEDRKPLKRFKTLPATPINAPVASSLELCVAQLLKSIQEIPSNLIMESLYSSLDRVANEAAFATLTRASHNDIIRDIDAQIKTLTEAENNEPKYETSIELTILELKVLKIYLPVPHEPMPSPSLFALKSHWAPAQMGPNAILCLRPSERRGLPLITLHEAFLFFVNESKKPLPATESAALEAAHHLCREMAEPYESDLERRSIFNWVLGAFILKNDWEIEIKFGSEPGLCGRIGGAHSDYALLREDKAELDTDGDSYMRIARGFQAFVAWNQSQHSDHGKPGVAKFLLTLTGPTLMISGGFYDGKSTIIEPLTPGMMMLPDYDINGRPMVVAQCLFALKKAIDLIRVPPKQSVVAGTPCIYSSVLSDEDTTIEIPISFVEPLPGLAPLVFSATATIESEVLPCLVKLVYGRYGAEAHRLLARDGLAPELFGIRIVEGAPIAVAMEYLKPYSRRSEGWATIFSFAPQITEYDEQRRLGMAVHEIVKKLERANLVHGDLRSNNLMVHVNANGSILDGEDVWVKVIDFDWSGQSGEVAYPTARNTTLWWPAGVAEEIVIGHDQAVVKHWFMETFPDQVYPVR